jgi:hypothetical protein
MAKDGVCMIVEPFANDILKDNLNSVGRVYYAASTFIRTPASLSQEVALGTRRPTRRVPTASGRGRSGFHMISPRYGDAVQYDL